MHALHSQIVGSTPVLASCRRAQRAIASYLAPGALSGSSSWKLWLTKHVTSPSLAGTTFLRSSFACTFSLG